MVQAARWVDVSRTLRGFGVQKLMHVRSEWQRVEQCYVALQKGRLAGKLDG